MGRLTDTVPSLAGRATSSEGPTRSHQEAQISPHTVREIYRRLRERLGPLDPPRRLDPLEELVLTVLSQSTSDVNRDRAFRAMRARYPTWEALGEADPGELAATIRAGGLSNVKAPRILAILQTIRDRQGGSLDLSWMRGAPTGSVRAYLTSLPGVGPKTAACVMAFSLGRAALPVDTHVYRVARRLGFFDGRVSAAAAHQVMERAVPPALRVRMHVGLIGLGRQVCRAGLPRCPACPLLDLCPSAPSFLAARPPGPPAPGAAGGEGGRTGRPGP